MPHVVGPRDPVGEHDLSALVPQGVGHDHVDAAADHEASVNLLDANTARAQVGHASGDLSGPDQYTDVDGQPHPPAEPALLGVLQLRLEVALLHLLVGIELPIAALERVQVEEAKDRGDRGLPTEWLQRVRRSSGVV